MTQTLDKPKEDKGRFVQYPFSLIYGHPELTRDDKWVALSVMGECWTNGPHRLSYREVAALSNVPLSLLSSIKGKGGKPDKEGIMERLERNLTWLTIILAKAINPATGKPKGNAQTYILIDYKLLWQENSEYCETRKVTDGKERYRCEENSYQPVSYTNRLECNSVLNTNEPVSYTNEPVSYTNEPVRIENEPVSYTNEPVRSVSSKAPPYITHILQTTNTLEDTSNVVAAIADTDALSSIFVSNAENDQSNDTQSLEASLPTQTETTPNENESHYHAQLPDEAEQPQDLQQQPIPVNPQETLECLTGNNAIIAHSQKEAVQFASQSEIEALQESSTSVVEVNSGKQAGGVSHSQSTTQKPAVSRSRKKVPKPEKVVEPEVEDVSCKPRLPGKPTSPPSMELKAADFMVQYTEYRIGKYYTPRQYAKQKEAAGRIIKIAQGTKEQYILAYDRRNSPWWRDNRGLLHVVTMAQKTPRGEMRFVEEWEAVEYKSEAPVGNTNPKEQQDYGDVSEHEKRQIERFMRENPEAAALLVGA